MKMAWFWRAMKVNNTLRTPWPAGSALLYRNDEYVTTFTMSYTQTGTNASIVVGPSSDLKVIKFSKTTPWLRGRKRSIRAIIKLMLWRGLRRIGPTSSRLIIIKIDMSYLRSVTQNRKKPRWYLQNLNPRKPTLPIWNGRSSWSRDRSGSLITLIRL